jgi:tyrosinase
MTQFDVSDTVNNLLSGSSQTAQERIGTVIRTAADLAAVPGVDTARLRGLSGTASDLGRGLLGGPQRQAPTSQPVQKSTFNPFDLEDTRAAVVMASKLMEIAERKGGDAGLADAIGALGALGEVMGEVSGLAGNLVGDLTAEVNEIVGEIGADVLNLLGLRQRALELFVTHYPPAREKFKLEPLEQRQPNLIRRSGAGATPPENQVSFWREDAQLNEHHGRWHDVNPLFGRPVAGGRPDMGDRHGELFVYMHVQMLARYDAERLGVGLPRVQPFDDYRAPIPEGYDPGDLMAWTGTEWEAFSKRDPNDTFKDLVSPVPAPIVNRRGARLENMEKARDALREAAGQGRYTINVGNEPIVLTNDNFGNTIEANFLSVDFPVKDNPRDPANGANYGNLHNDGHTHGAYIHNEEAPIGVLGNLAATVRDPLFWRWHKHIDTIVQEWRETLARQQPHDFGDGPPVTVRTEDIILCRKEGLPADFDGEMLGAEVFGYTGETDLARLERWNTDFSSNTVTLSDGRTVTTTAELLTEMRTRIIQVHDPASGPTGSGTITEEIDYLSHEDFFYFIRLQNRSDQAQQVTIRIFLAPEPWVDDNTAWIEMDRFLHRLAGQEHVVVFRPARLSAVIRKPALGHEELESTEPRPPATVWCDCGWPYTLLLPRSTKDGMDFRLLVMLSSDDLTMTDTGEVCTSMSYCGLKDSNYPDKRLMGYPFDRALTDSIDSVIDKHENWASRAIQIRCRNLP